MPDDLVTRPSTDATHPDLPRTAAADPDPPRMPAVAAPADAWIRPATRWAALLLISAIVLYLCWLIVSPFVDVILWSVVLVVVFAPVHRRIRERIGSPNWAAATSCALVILAILLPLTLITIMIAHDAGRVADAVQQHKDEWLDPDSPTVVGRALRWVDHFVDVDRVASRQYVAERMRAISGTLAARTLNLVGGALGVLVQVFFVIFTMFYLFRDGERLRAGVRQVLPLDRWQSHEVFLRTRDVIYASVYGSVVIALVQGAMGAAAFWVLGVPSALLWAAVMTVSCMIPIAGAFVVWLPVAIYLLATGHWVKALVLTIWGAAAIGSVDNILRAKLVGQRTRMHELIVFFAVLGGLQVFGMLGIVAGPAVAAVAMALFEIWRRSGSGEHATRSEREIIATAPAIVVKPADEPGVAEAPAIPADEVASAIFRETS